MTTMIKIKTVKRASGYQARYELPSGQPVRHTGYATREDAVTAARANIMRVMDTKVPGMSAVSIEVARG